jgi:hypothetical protein
VAVGDARILERGFEAAGVRPGILAPAHAAPLADIEEKRYPGAPEGRDEAGPVEAVDADRGEGAAQYRGG